MAGTGHASPVAAWGKFLANKQRRRSAEVFGKPFLRLEVISAMASPTTTCPLKRQKDPKKRVVITGMGLVSVFGNDVDCFYDELLRGANGVNMIDRFDTSELAVKFAAQIGMFSSEGYIDQKSDRRLDDCWRYCLVAGKKALESAVLGPQQLNNAWGKFMCNIPMSDASQIYRHGARPDIFNVVAPPPLHACIESAATAVNAAAVVVASAIFACNFTRPSPYKTSHLHFSFIKAA